ncbi:Prepilin-type N-terminal cleavage/methylation domain-containing protein [Bacillus cereus]|nr:Prepilin-type N-terminal cleavage/methylation domain-containing protein [Bacillus cereus]
MLLCRRKNKLEFGFSLIEMILCLFLLSIFFLLLPRLHFIEMGNKQSKGLNDWEWDVYLGQMQLEFREVSSGEQLSFEMEKVFYDSDRVMGVKYRMKKRIVVL